MQAVPLAALNASVMAAFKSPSLSPPSAEIAQTLGKIAGNQIYEISATTSPPATKMEAHTDTDDKCSIEDDVVSYTAQYYPAIESHSRASTPSTVAPGSPKDCAGHLTPVSVSSKDSSSSEGLSPLDDEGMESLPHQSMCIPISSEAQEEQGNGGTQVRHWTYEDQFKQLYNLSHEAERKEFLDKLFNYMQSKGTPITRIPIMAKQPLDLYKLFKLVVERGGLVEVIKKKAWRNVAKELNLPASITSAAFTMRSQYVKYLYPYECETVKLSEPQELQMAIDSNKRDRRHSENLDFIAPQLQRDMDPNLSPVITTTHQGLQLISSPTMALPHGSLPPYSGGFIVAGGPGGTPQLVQMTPHVPGIPIVMPSPTVPVSTPSQILPSSHTHSSSEDRDDVQSHASGENSEPPAKRPALDGNHVKATVGSNRGPYSIHQTTAGNFIMAHGSVASPGSHHLIQMSPHGQIPLVLPTTPVSTAREQQKCPPPSHNLQLNGRTESSSKTTENGGLTVTAISPHPGNIILAQRGSPVTPQTHNLFHMAHHPTIPGLITIPSNQAGAAPPTPKVDGEEKRRATAEKDKVVGTCNSTPSVVKMPIANISIQSAGGKTEGGEQNGSDASLLVTLEINNTVYQGVLFAKPQAVSSPQQ